MIEDIEDSVDVNGILIAQKPAYDNILNFKIALQWDEKVVADQAKQRELGPEGKIFGRYDANPMLKYMIYEVDFPDGQMQY